MPPKFNRGGRGNFKQIKLCRDFLLGSCNKKDCWFLHADFTEWEHSQLEGVLERFPDDVPDMFYELLERAVEKVQDVEKQGRDLRRVQGELNRALQQANALENALADVSSEQTAKSVMIEHLSKERAQAMQALNTMRLKMDQEAAERAEIERSFKKKNSELQEKIADFESRLVTARRFEAKLLVELKNMKEQFDRQTEAFAGQIEGKINDFESRLLAAHEQVEQTKSKTVGSGCLNLGCFKALMSPFQAQLMEIKIGLFGAHSTKEVFDAKFELKNMKEQFERQAEEFANECKKELDIETNERGKVEQELQNTQTELIKAKKEFENSQRECQRIKKELESAEKQLQDSSSVKATLPLLTQAAENELKKQSSSGYGHFSFFVNPCLQSGQVVSLFEKALQYHKQPCLFGTKIVFHGTSIDSAQKIFCEGYDPQNRQRQQYGVGEYFADWQTAQQYNNGAMLAVLVFPHNDVVTYDANDMIVIRNPEDRSRTYCLPLVCAVSNGAGASNNRLFNSGYWMGANFGTVSSRASFPPCRKCQPQAPPSANNHNSVQFLNDNNQWQDMDQAITKQILPAYTRNGVKVQFSNGKFTYEIDWATMIQTNQKTNKQRRIRLV